jgi:hypothetical protein
MLSKLLITLSCCLIATTALGAGACKGKACRYTYFEKDTQGCLSIRNAGREDIQVTVYTAGSGAITVRVMSGHTETVYKTSRACVPAVDYVRADAEFDGGLFAPPL